MMVRELAAADLVVLARSTAAMLPAAPAVVSDDDPLLREWEDLVAAAVQFLALRAGSDEAVLSAALWPPVDVAANPSWRVLLTMALLSVRRRSPVAAPLEVQPVSAAT